MITEVYNLIITLFTLDGATAETQALLNLVALVISIVIITGALFLIFKMFFAICRRLWR